MAKRRHDSLESLAARIEYLSNAVSSLERKIDSFSATARAKGGRGFDVGDIVGRLTPEQLRAFRARTEHLTERTERMAELFEQTERPLTRESLGKVHGRHREILVMLINNGFHTYDQIAKQLSISNSRARAYVAELKNDYGLPIRQVRDAEGYKVGIETRFVEQILALK
jgi:biotin operon repressor